jgi:energy-coupling factor transport system permease protein
MINTWTWFLWIAGVLITLSSTRNPLYLILILLCLVIVDLSLHRQDSDSPGGGNGRVIPVSPLKIALILISLSALFNAASSHFGETILFYLPGNWPLVGGAITLEALVYGAINGLILFGIFYTFIVLNQALSIRRLIRIIPKAFYPVAIVTSIAVTFFPTTVRQFNQIREAQAIRGHQTKGIRDWIPLLMPLLIGGMERALSLAESMSARGLAQGNEEREIWWSRSLMIFGVLLTLSGWLFQLSTTWQAYGTLLLLLGICTILAVLWSIGRQKPHISYLQENWQKIDFIILSGVALTLVVVLLPIPFIDQSSLVYEVYPHLNLPGFNPLIGITLLGLLTPIFIQRSKKGVKKP